MKTFIAHLKTYILRGLLAVIPLVLCMITVKIIYEAIDKKVTNLLDQFIGFRVPGLGIILVLILLYFIGIITTNVLGREIFNLVERLFKRIPLINSVYQVGKQVSQTLSLPGKEAFKKAVLVECFKKGHKLIGFVTGSLEEQSTNKKLIKVFIPTVPNPTSGFLFIFEESEVFDPGWTIEEAMKVIISGGIIGPSQIK